MCYKRIMYRLILIILFSVPSMAQARLCTYLKNGVSTISSKPIAGAKRIGCLGRNEDTPRRRVKKSRSKLGTSQKNRRRAQRYSSFVKRAAKTYSLPEALIWAVMRTESAFDPTVVSHKGAQGLMQLLPKTAKAMGVKDSFDPEENIMGGARYLRLLANRFDGDTVKMIAGYHAGGGAVSAANGIPFERTGIYLRRVLNAYYAYQNKLPTESP
jgi:soluble lytic murein transglycosylase-like protein